ncbi:hypothetical protein CDCA_CDCA12G3513 [Cyanidium caldarium]|uniref:Uncharacterized protein n=1 Tax=Cyanidium caldarium TaxID=2771 RepID=A0AAV9IZG5_CYACA|nr:hypothetical protein CDCA_CDCA12G3513 [Cyanidium caldarium]
MRRRSSPQIKQPHHGLYRFFGIHGLSLYSGVLIAFLFLAWHTARHRPITLFFPYLPLPARTPSLCESPAPRDGIPAVILTNWEDQVITLAIERDCPDTPRPDRLPGITSYRLFGEDLVGGASSVSSDTVALRPVHCSDAVTSDRCTYGPVVTLSSRGFSCTRHGSCTATYDSSEWTLNVTYRFPPQQPFYLTEVQVAAPPGITAVSLLSLLITEALATRLGGAPVLCQPNVEYDAAAEVYVADTTACGGYYLASGTWNQSAVSGYAVLPEDAALRDYFAAGRPLHNVTEAVLRRAGIAVEMQMPLIDTAATVTAPVHWFRALGRTRAEVMAAVRRAHGTIQDADSRPSVLDWQAHTRDAYETWLARGPAPDRCPDGDTTDSGCLDADALRLYEHSLVLMKNSQNPYSGALVSSFHPLYGYKQWMRDAALLTTIFTELNYTDEARQWLQWASRLELRPVAAGGGYHTCYDAWTGQVADFVEPQYDASFAYLLAASRYALRTDNDSLWYYPYGRSRMQSLQEWLLRSREADGLVPPDYSIWEESSDPVSGRALPPKYYAFTQAMAYAAAVAAAQVARRFQHDDARADALMQRAAEIRAAVNRWFWDDRRGYYARAVERMDVWPAPDVPVVDARLDASALFVCLFGMQQHPGQCQRHVEASRQRLQTCGDGVMRYRHDAYFHDGVFSPCGREATARSPPWGVCTAFQLWADLLHGRRDAALRRLQWLVRHAARGHMPVGEANDPVTGVGLQASSPDIYEYAGVYALSVLLVQRRAWFWNPLANLTDA